MRIKIRNYLDKRLNILEDVVNIVDGQTESLRDLELGHIIVLLSANSLNHFIGIKYGDLANILENKLLQL